MAEIRYYNLGILRETNLAVVAAGVTPEKCVSLNSITTVAIITTIAKGTCEEVADWRSLNRFKTSSSCTMARNSYSKAHRVGYTEMYSIMARVMSLNS